MPLFGSSSRSRSVSTQQSTNITTTSTETQDRRTLAEAGGVAAQEVGGDIVFQQTAEGALETVGEAVDDALSFAQAGLLEATGIAQTSVEALAQSRQTNINPVMVLLAVGVVVLLATGGLKIRL